MYESAHIHRIFVRVYLLLYTHHICIIKIVENEKKKKDSSS